MNNDIATAARALIAALGSTAHPAIASQIAALEAAIAAPPPRIIINVTGGVVQGASIDRATDIDVLILDFDCDDEDDDDVMAIPDEDGEGSELGSACELGSIDVNPEWVGKVYAALDARD